MKIFVALIIIFVFGWVLAKTQHKNEEHELFLEKEGEYVEIANNIYKRCQIDPFLADQFKSIDNDAFNANTTSEMELCISRIKELLDRLEIFEVVYGI